MLLKDDEEEKKKRLQEAMDITNRINSNGFNSEDYGDNINSASNDLYNQRLQEAMNITNSINPITYTRKSSSNIKQTPDLDGSSLSDNQDEEQEEKKTIEVFKGSKAFDDGYQFGDLTKTAAGTVNDIVGDLVSGVASVGENVVDLGANIVATIQKWTGNKEASNKTKEWANTNYSEKLGNVVANALPVGVLYNTMNGTLDWNLEKNSFEEASVLGETSDKVVNLVGYTVGLAAGTKGLDKLGSTISAVKGTDTVAQLGNIPLKIGSKTLSLPTLAVVGGASRRICRSQRKRGKCNRTRKME